MTAEPLLTDEMKQEIRDLYEHLPVKSAACIEGLKVIQKHRRWVSDDSIKELASLLDMSAEAVDSVATYYSLIFRKPIGRHVILVCDSVSCWIMGYPEIINGLKEKLSIGYGETTADDRFTLLPIPCLGTCDRAPALLVDEDLHRDLTADKLDALLERYK
jgi:NADH-quinone oxidoreductase subunit E